MIGMFFKHRATWYPDILCAIEIVNILSVTLRRRAVMIMGLGDGLPMEPPMARIMGQINLPPQRLPRYIHDKNAPQGSHGHIPKASHKHPLSMPFILFRCADSCCKHPIWHQKRGPSSQCPEKCSKLLKTVRNEDTTIWQIYRVIFFTGPP